MERNCNLSIWSTITHRYLRPIAISNDICLSALLDKLVVHPASFVSWLELGDVPERRCESEVFLGIDDFNDDEVVLRPPSITCVIPRLRRRRNVEHTEASEFDLNRDSGNCLRHVRCRVACQCLWLVTLRQDLELGLSRLEIITPLVRVPLKLEANGTVIFLTIEGDFGPLPFFDHISVCALVDQRPLDPTI